MEIKLYPEVETVKQYKPALAHKTDRKYKWRAMLYKKIAIALGVILLGIGYLLFLTLRGNLSLQRQLAEKPAFLILPDGKMISSK